MKRRREAGREAPMVIWPADVARFLRQIWNVLRAFFAHLFGGRSDAGDSRRPDH
jgi:hypothetical protein